MSGAYYNEIDPYAAQWLRNLIVAGHIAPGVVDERSIEDVHPDDLRGFTQCHFFAGIGIWSLALRNAGWADDRPVWTGSCPCQPFSQAGTGSGFDDQRHLWPHFHWLIQECGPAVVLGEQVASKDADAWIDLVQDDLEGLGYGVGAVPFPAAGIGAPHIRDRLYWMAYANSKRSLPRTQSRVHRRQESSGSRHGEPQRSGPVGGMAHTNNGRLSQASICGIHDQEPHTESRSGALKGPELAGPINGFWRDADWLGCRDGKFRPVEPRSFPLAHGATQRVGRLRAYGNGICAPAAAEFCAIALEFCTQ